MMFLQARKRQKRHGGRQADEGEGVVELAENGGGHHDDADHQGDEPAYIGNAPVETQAEFGTFVRSVSIR